MTALQEKEAKMMEEETARAQAEQMRLLEAQKLEEEVRNYKDEERRKAAAASDRVTFEWNGVTINQIVFEEDETEDLELFPNDPFGVPSDKEIAQFIAKIRESFAASIAANQEQEEEWDQNINDLTENLQNKAVVA